MDDKLKKLINKDNIEIPESFENKFEDTLSNLSSKKVHKYNKYAMVASLALVVIVGSGVAMAISDGKYKYIPSSGELFDSEKSVYGLEEKIVGTDNNGEEIQLDIFISEELNRGIANTNGKFNSPKSEKAELKIGDKVYKNERTNLGKLDNTWGATDVFNDISDYKEGDQVVYTIYTDDKNKVDFNVQLKKIEGVSRYSDLGITSEDNNIPITAIIDEKEDYMRVDFITDIEAGKHITTGSDDGITSGIYLLDANGTRVSGKRETSGGAVKLNQVKFDTKKLVKPYEIIIPKLVVDFISEDMDGVISEEIILQVPKDGQTIDIDKEIKMDIGNNFVNTGNDTVKIVKGTRNKNKYILQLEHMENEKSEDYLRQVVAVKNNSIGKDGIIYEQSSVDEDFNLVKNIELDINMFTKNIKFKLSPIMYEIKGEWVFKIN